jgi:hypothetical protein
MCLKLIKLSFIPVSNELVVKEVDRVAKMIDEEDVEVVANGKLSDPSKNICF